MAEVCCGGEIDRDRNSGVLRWSQRRQEAQVVAVKERNVALARFDSNSGLDRNQSCEVDEEEKGGNGLCLGLGLESGRRKVGFGIFFFGIFVTLEDFFP